MSILPRVALAILLALRGAAFPQDPGAAEQAARSLGLQGGLCVQIGGDEATFGLPLAMTGRFLVHALHDNGAKVDAARQRLGQGAPYGLISADLIEAPGLLPYTENLVNLLVILERPSFGLPAEEIRRVLCPNGAVLAAPGAVSADALKSAGLEKAGPAPGYGAWTAARKPWPAGMDGWTHSRHSASGNAVSNDIFAAPPRRVRWVAAATSEVPGMVTAAGRNFYAAAVARDGFNGLRLWHRDLVSSTSRGPFVMRNLARGQPAPVATERHLFVVSDRKLLALDAATGKTIRAYDEAGDPKEVLHDRGILFAVTGDSVRALDVGSGKSLWRVDVADPRCAVAGEDTVAFIGEKKKLMAVERDTGKVRWTRGDYPWIAKVYRCVYHRGMLACEVSSLNDNAPGNALHLLSAANGTTLLDHEFMPGMNHKRQARAMFVGERLWILHGGKDAEKKAHRTQISSLDPRTGEVRKTFPAGLTHCFPPVATPRYMLAGEMDFTDLETGKVDAYQITKAACGRESGWVPANGLVYVTPKHCVCWPMLRGYAALAPERPQAEGVLLRPKESDFQLRKEGPPPPRAAGTPEDSDWPMYRRDAWRSGSTPAKGPRELKTLWTADLGAAGAEGPIAADWEENPFVKGPVTAPVVSGDIVCLARPDAHEVVALDRRTGSVRWRRTVEGRVDTAPTLHKGLCLFGSKGGWVHGLRAEDGRPVWKLRAAPLDERIVAYGQLESPWPVPGSILVVDDTAYFAAGRQSLADGGILVFAADPRTGAVRWVSRLDSVPQKGFYACSALEFDNFDLLHREEDGVAMSRWRFDRATGKMSIDPWRAFSRIDTGGGAVWVPQGSWSYAPRHQRRINSYAPLRPLVVFRGNVLLGCLEDKKSIFRRDFNLEEGEDFDTKWMTGWKASQLARDKKMPWRNHRLAEKARWSVAAFEGGPRPQEVAAMALAGDRLYLAGSGGELQARSVSDGRLLEKSSIPEPLWDGIAVAGGRLYVSTRDGKVLCLGGEGTDR